MLAVQDIVKLTPEEIDKIPVQERLELARQIEQQRAQWRKENAILFYQVVNPDALGIHLSTAKEILASGGNRSSKTESILAEAVIQMTGIVPLSLKNIYPMAKIRPPIRMRLICKSLTNTWEPVIKRKLQWWQWSGDAEPGSPNGHWGWIPKHLLIKGDWMESWSEKYRTLTLTNGSTMQVMSREQELEDFSGASCHLIVVDEGIDNARYRENKARTIDCSGRLMMAMTPPDDQSAAWEAAWVYDALYERGMPGPNKDPDIDSFTLFTEKNRILPKEEIAKTVKDMTEEQKEVRLHGRFLHLSGRIYTTYTDREQYWCFQCNKNIIVLDGKSCSVCKSSNIVLYCHLIEPFEKAFSWPCVMLLDPHPRKPHCLAWWVVTPSDDLIQVAELEVDDTPVNVKKAVDEMERDLHLRVYRRLIDPNMGESPSTTSAVRHRTVRQEFDDVGLRCALADDNRMTAQIGIKEYLKPDPRTLQPRMQIFNRCRKSNYQMMHYSWGEWTRFTSDMRNPKPIPQDKDDDFPTLAGYLMNDHPTFRSMQGSVMAFKTQAAQAREQETGRSQYHVHT